MTTTTYTRYSASCLSCKSEISLNNFEKHQGSNQCKSGGKFKYNAAGYTPRVSLVCIHCNKLCKNTLSVSQHEPRCKLNPDKISTVPGKTRIHKIIEPTACNYCLTAYTTKSGLNNHIIRCPKNPNRLLHVVTPAGKLAGKEKSDAGVALYWSKADNKVLASTRMQKAVVDHPDAYMHSNRGRVKQIIHDNIKFQGQWEVDFYVWCKLNNISTQRCTEWFTYEYNGTTHRYNPDFYLSEFDMYAEVKGYETERDRLKWEYLTNKHHKVLCIVDKRSIMSVKNNTITMQELLDNYMHK